MKHVHLTWYLLVDGTHADPNDVSPDKDGVLRHKNGLAVALHENGTPMSIGKCAVENKNVEAAEAGEAAVAEAIQMKADVDAAAKADAAPAPDVAAEIDPATGDVAKAADKKDPVKSRVTKPAPSKKFKTR